MIYESKITCESIPASVQMIYVSNITCEGIPTRCLHDLCK